MEAEAHDDAQGGVVVPLWDGPLGALLVNSELLTSEQVEDALREAARRGRRLGEIVLERGWIHERTLANCLARQKALEFVSLRDRALDRSAARLLSQDVALRYGALPIAFADGCAEVAIADPTNEAAMARVRDALDIDVRFAVAAPSELASALVKAYGDLDETMDAPVRQEPAEDENAPRDPTLDEAVGEDDRTATAGTAFHVIIRLRQTDPVDAGVFDGLTAAETWAKNLLRHVTETDPDDWPLVGGRFLRPEAILSIDIIEAAEHGTGDPPPAENIR